MNSVTFGKMKVLNVKVKPNSPETKIISQTETEIKIGVAAPAENNKANIELIKFLKKHFGADVQIVRGATSRKKVIRIS